LDVGEENEPPVPCSLFQLASTFGAAHAASGILATDTYPKEETIRCERSEEAMDAVVVTEGASSESSEQNDDDCRA